MADCNVIQRMNSFIKQAFLSIGGDTLLRHYNKVPRVLFWHGVDYRCDKNVEQEIFDIEIFEKQISYLERHYEIISIDEFHNRFVNHCFNGKEVVLTFDDGYANNLYVVEPILHRYSLPFTVFVSAEHVDEGLYFPTSVNRIITLGSGLKSISIPSQNLHLSTNTIDERKETAALISSLLKSLPVDDVKAITNELIANVSPQEWVSLQEKFKSVRPMTWSEVKELSDKGVTIGSHCMWHICCHNNQQEQVVKYQLEESKRQIEEHVGKECKYFAYPNGDYTGFSNSIVSNTYSMGFSTEAQKSVINCRNVATVPRIGVVGNMDTFKILTNLYPKKK